MNIWVVGSTMIDMIAYSERIPGPGETVVGQRFQMGFGGKGANQAVMARNLGADVGIINCLGTDIFGDQTIENFQSLGIDTRFVTRTSDVSSGVAPIWVQPDGTNRIICVPGANFAMGAGESADAVRQAETVDLVLGQFEMLQETTAGAVRAGRERGAVTVLNPAPAATPIPELLEQTDWLVPNEHEFADISVPFLGRRGDATQPRDVAELARTLELRLLVTIGDKGAALCRADGEVVYIGPPAVQAVDTTGAGDAFVGAFCYGLAGGMAEEEAVRLGCACAALSVTKPGTQISFPQGEDLERARAWACTGGNL
jgi:ribokinase